MTQINKTISKRKGLSHTPKSYKNIYRSIKMNQIKPQNTAKEAQKQANQTGKNVRLNHDIPIYELSLHNITVDMANSFKYIRECFDKLNKRQCNAIIYKMEHGVKIPFFTCANLH